MTAVHDVHVPFVFMPPVVTSEDPRNVRSGALVGRARRFMEKHENFN